MRRVLGTLHEPNALTVALLLATGIVVIARHPIARALGTEVDTPVAGVTPAAAPPAAHSAQLPALALPVPVVTHAAVDPFRALISESGTLLAPSVAVAAPGATAPAAHAVVPTVSPASTCTGTPHRIVAGDSLWTLAARAVHSSNNARVTVAWHRIYSANRSVLGPNPALIRVGEALCVPGNI
jgi:nucleoid-associated protein YgaU